MAGRAGSNRAANGLPTIGLLLADLHTGASSSVWASAASEAAHRGMNLFCFPGGKLKPGGARTSLFELAGPEGLEGLLTWPTSFADNLPGEEVEALHARLLPLPMVSLSQTLPGIPTAALDAYPGARELIGHLLADHGFRKVAFIRGPSTHPSAEDRLRAYRDALQQFDVPQDDRLISPPVEWGAGEEAARVLLEERGLRPGVDVQAVAAASDLLAFGALRAFQARGFRVPADLAVVGFNDTPESRLASPPLTTAAMPFREQVGKAMDMLTEMMEGTRVPQSVTLPPRLVIRQSCGCLSAAAALAAFDPSGAEAGCAPDRLPDAFAEQRESCLAEMALLTELSEEAASAWLDPLLDAYLLDVAARQRGLFIATLDRALDRAIRSGVEVTAWQGALSALRRRSLAVLSPGARQGVENLLSQARVMVAEASQRQRMWWQWHAERQAGTLREIGTSLLGTFDRDRLCDALDECLPRLGIASFYLALVNPEGTEANLVLARTDQARASLPVGGIRYPARCIVPREFLPRTRRYDMAVVPLAFQEQRLALAVLEIGPADGSVYEALRGYLSSALRGVLLLEDAEKARRAAEKADLVKTRLLANVSHELRAPLDIIIRRARGAQKRSARGGRPRTLAEDLAVITGNAEHQLRVIDDLLDLSRAEIDQLDLDLAPVDPRPVLLDAFHGMAGESDASAGDHGPTGVQWRLRVPRRLPIVQADAMRLRQILLNLLANARAVTARGSIELAAEVDPPFLHLSVTDTGPGIEGRLLERIFEPFVSAERASPMGRGIGLGLSIARHLALLHGGTLTAESTPGTGSVFHLRLPLPSLVGRVTDSEGEPFLALVSRTAEPPEQIAEFCARRGLAIRLLRADGDWEAALGSARPAAIAWDLSQAEPGQWKLVRRLRHHPRLFQVPVVLYTRPVDEGTGGPAGLTGVAAKSSPPATLLEFIEAARPKDGPGPLLIVDDDPQERETLEAAARSGLPDLPVQRAADGAEALRRMSEDRPCLVVLDLMMPVLDGFGVLEAMRADSRLRAVPVLVLTHKGLDPEDVRRLEAHGTLTLQSKGVWSPDEAAAAMQRALFEEDRLPPHTSAIAKRAIAWLAENHAHPVARWQLAEAVHASEDYLCRVFRKELGLSPWEYLSRYRIHKAKELLTGADASVKEIAAQVGIRDPAYFSRVFRKLTGVSPQTFRARPPEAGPAGP